MLDRQGVIDRNDGATEEFRALVFFIVVYGSLRSFGLWFWRGKKYLGIYYLRSIEFLCRIMFLPKTPLLTGVSSCPVKLKTCGFETTKTIPASWNYCTRIDSSCPVNYKEANIKSTLIKSCKPVSTPPLLVSTPHKHVVSKPHSENLDTHFFSTLWHLFSETTPLIFKKTWHIIDYLYIYIIF